jgi:hypothetical protein
VKPSVRSILLTVALVMGANGVMAAQNSSDWFEQWYKAKYGRNSPAEEARQAAERNNTASREEVAPAAAKPANDWFERWYQAKVGRNSRMEELRQRIETENTIEEAANESAGPVAVHPSAVHSSNDWRAQLYKAKLGRSPLPVEAPQKLQGKL